uniref:ANK_REP_REGION domain-containing protein n=1 Tax=Panagrellus redivivus TaxID=6233 RepID=A0A7E4ZXS2_PANRE
MVRSLSALADTQGLPAPTPASLTFNEAPFAESYDVGEELGSGQFAVVYKVTSRKTGEKFAAKFIKKRRYATSRRGVPRAHIEREVEVLKAVGGHENVIQIIDVFETGNDVILVLELVSGGELFDHVCAREHLDEAEACAFIKQILNGIRHLHTNYVVHLDIKPENLMLRKKGETQLKLIDFGLSRHIYPGTPVKDMIGTPEFVAPEVVNYEPLSPATDMWALGVVTYILLSGVSPFLGRNRDETFCNITSVNYHFSPTYFGTTSQLAKDFIGRLFVKDSHSRATVDDCLNHPWVRGPRAGGPSDLRLNSTINVAKIHGFKVRMRWRKAVEVIQHCRQITRRAREELKLATSRGYTLESRYNKGEIVPFVLDTLMLALDA